MTISMSGYTISGGVSIAGQDPPPPPPPIVTDGLIMQLDADNPSSYPGTGTSVFDVTGGYTHTLAAADQFTTLNGIKCFNFPFNSSVLTVNGTGPTLPITTGYTYVLWVNTQTAGSINRTLIRVSSSTQPIARSNTSNNLGILDSGNFVQTGYNPSGLLGSWKQLTMWGNGTNGGNKRCEYYVDTSFAGFVGLVNDNGRGSTHVNIGNNGQGGQVGWGYVANCLLYNRVLSGAEIAVNFNALKSRFGVS